MQTDKISIIVPIYNADEFLEKCLTSLIEQTYENIEIICVNDGSVDQSLEIMQKFASQDHRITVYSQQNQGIAGAHNTGLQHATGQYIMFCDADDSMQPNMCQIMLETLKSAEVDIVSCNTNVISDKETHYRKYLKNAYTGKYEICLPLIQKMNVLLCNKLFKKDLIDTYQITFPIGHEHDDDCFFMQYISVAKTVYFLEDALYNYWVHAGSMSEHYLTRNPQHLYDKYFALKVYYDFLKHHKLLTLCLELFAWFLLVEYAVMIKNMNKSEITKLRNMITQNFVFTNTTMIHDILQHRHNIRLGKITFLSRKIRTVPLPSNQLKWILISTWIGFRQTEKQLLFTPHKS